MPWVAFCLGLACGGANYALLALGCGRLTGGKKRGALWISGGVLLPVAGLVICALASPALLVRFGCACAGMLTLLALIQMIYQLRKSRKK